MRQNEKRRVQNQSIKTRVKTARRRFFEAAAESGEGDTDALFREYCSVLDRATKANVLTKNTASRRKTRAQARLAAQKG